jgi:hypothetical protein
MTKVYLNPSKLDEKLSTVDLFRSSVESACSLIRNHYTQDPIREELSSCLDNFSKAGQGLLLRTDEIRRIKKNIEQLNSTGVATFDSATGQITFEVPDGVDVDTPKNLEMWSQGTLDANDLRSGESKLPSGRSFDEVMESMKANKGDTTYANSFIDRVGPENLTKLGADPDVLKNREAPVVGEILATASQTWDKEKSKRNADLIIGSVDDESEWDRIPVLNEMIGGHDADNDGISDLKFGANFLAFMGAAAEQLPYKDIRNEKNPNVGPPGKHKKGSPFSSYLDRFDPLLGIVDAMTNNGEAAAMFFGTKGVDASENDIERTRRLAQRYSFGDNKWTNNLAIISDKMSEFGLINTTEASPERIKLADQAALGTSVILNTIGESNIDLSGTSISHIGNALKNYAAGVDHSINNAGNVNGDTAVTYLSGKIPNGSDGFTTSYTENYWGNGLATQPNFSDATLSNLTGQLGLTEHGLDGLQARLGYIADRRISYAANPDESEGNKKSALTTAISNYRRTQGFIAGAISNEGVERGIQADDKVNKWINGISGVTGFIPVPGIPGVSKSLEHVFKTGVSYVAGVAEKEAMNELEERYAKNEREAEVKATDLIGDNKHVVTNDIMKKMMQGGIIEKDRLAGWSGRDETVVAPDGSLNYENLRKAEEGGDGKQIREATRNAFNNMGSRISEYTDSWVAESYNTGETAYEGGVDRARDHEDRHGNRIPPKKFKE